MVLWSKHAIKFISEDSKMKKMFKELGTMSKGIKKTLNHTDAMKKKWRS